MKIKKCWKNHIILWRCDLDLWSYDLEKVIRSGHYHYQCVYQIGDQSIPWFLSYRVNTIAGGGWQVAGGGRRVAGGRRLRRKTITSPDPSDTGDIKILHLESQRSAILFWRSDSYPATGPKFCVIPVTNCWAHITLPQIYMTDPHRLSC